MSRSVMSLRGRAQRQGPSTRADFGIAIGIGIEIDCDPDPDSKPDTSLQRGRGIKQSVPSAMP